MQTLSTVIHAAAQYLSRLTLYEMLRSSRDFEDVKEVLNARMNWSIELVSIFSLSSPFTDIFGQFRSCFT